MNRKVRTVAVIGVLALFAGVAIFLRHCLAARGTGREGPKAERAEGLEQGVIGRVLTPAGAPCADAEVFLLRAASPNAVENFLRARRGEVVPRDATGRTDRDGRFRLGTAVVDGVRDLCVVSDEFPELYCRSIGIRAHEWHETGDLRLETGIVVQGRVVQQGSRVPIPAATVFLQSTNATHSQVAPPGREKGLPAITDISGSFRYANAPCATTVSLMAEAPGFVKVLKQNVVLQPNVANQVDLELPAALPLTGTVHDVAGAPVSAAKIIAMAIGSGLPQVAETIRPEWPLRTAWSACGSVPARGLGCPVSRVPRAGVRGQHRRERLAGAARQRPDARVRQQRRTAP